MTDRCHEIFDQKFTADSYARNIEDVYRRAAEKRR